jgi:hypothetical protein
MFDRHCDLKPDNVLINIFPDNAVHLKVGMYLSNCSTMSIVVAMSDESVSTNNIDRVRIRSSVND